MDVSDLRQRILRALEAGKNDAALRRTEADAAVAAFDNFLVNVAVPLLKQAQSILKAEGQAFTVHSPAGSAKLVADGSSQTFLEFVLDSSGNRPHVIGRVSLARGSKRVVVDERPIATDKAIKDLGDDEVAAFLVTEIPKIVARG
jgi:hypothetical protein